MKLAVGLHSVLRTGGVKPAGPQPTGSKQVRYKMNQKNGGFLHFSFSKTTFTSFNLNPFIERNTRIK